jgi:hypothetical protein
VDLEEVQEHLKLAYGHQKATGSPEKMMFWDLDVETE